MSKKDFNSIKTEQVAKTTGQVYKSVEQGISTKGQQGTASPEEAKARAETLKTQGRKGCKAIRINMAFTPANHEYIRVMSKITGKTMTEFTNIVIEKYRQEHPEIYEEAKAILERL